MRPLFRNMIVGMLAATLLWPFGVPAQAQAVGLSAQLVSSNSPLAGKSGSGLAVTLKIKNTGSATWVNSGDHPIRLGTVRPKDRPGLSYHSSWVKSDRPATMQEASVAPNETATFQFTVVAAGNGGTITERLGLVVEGMAWIDKFETALVINVQPAIYSAQMVEQSKSQLTLKAKETAEVTVRVKNNGDVSWANAGATAVKIATSGPRDRKSNLYFAGWLSANRVAAADGETAPGQTATFKMTIQAPAKTGTVREQFGIVAEGIAWLEPVFTIELTTVPAVYSASLVSASDINIGMSPGDTTTVWAEVQNTGNTTWSSAGANPVKLGTAKPLDRSSGFAHSSWLSPNRAVLMSPAQVAPGEKARFEFTVQAPDKIGTYQETFWPVIEFVTWLPQAAVTWNIRVEEEVVLTDPLRVGLTSTDGPITVQGDSFVVRRGTDKGLVAKFHNQSVTVTALSFGYRLDSGQEVQDYLRIVPTNNSKLTIQASGIGSVYNTFRGIIEIRRATSARSVWVINILELDDYMKGVAEVPDSWHLEAVKAQAVAARTYAVSKRIAPREAEFDLRDDTIDQVYYGYNSEVQKPKLTIAVEATKRMVIKYNGQPIKAFFFSDSGGYTENVENVWGRGDPGQAIPYLKAVQDPYAKPIDWSATLTQDYLQARFDTTLGIAAASTDVIDKIEVAERFASGRIKTVLFTMRSGRTINVPFYTFDYLTNNNEVKSLKFDVQTVGFADRPDFMFTGQGWGHGVGMPQWGARNMAEAGKSFDEILRYYYTGVQVAAL